MGRLMTLRDMVTSLESLDDEGTVYAVRPWNGLSPVMIRDDEGERSALISDQLGLCYFLEVSPVKEVVERLEQELGRPVMVDERVERLVQYAETDA